ncbi:MAG: hypothetical protein HQP61_05965 [Peptococcaceae bacterium]|nr:hypothetical protein [Candidatus Syntrophopropionicum ammoniitolerans]
MSEKIEEVVKPCAKGGTTKTGYQELWNTGQAHNKKIKNKTRGINRPSV